MRKHITSFHNASKGLAWAYKTQSNFRFHILAMLVVVGAGFYFKVTTGEWLVLLLTIAGVLVAELLNTSLEAATDAHKLIKSTSEEDRLIGLAKDLGAAAVLVMSLGAVVIGLVIFLPRIFQL